MHKILKKLGLMLVAASLVLSGCKSGGGEPTATPVGAQAVFTAAAQTAAAQITELAAITPTAEPSSTPTEMPTATVEASATSPAATATITYAPVMGNLTDYAKFVQDITVPDYTTFAPNQPFRKTWRISNIGTSTWTPAYSLVFSSGNQLGGPTSVPLSGEVKPGDSFDLSVDLVSPASSGQYNSYWILRNPLGQNFGIGGANQPLYVIINVAANGTVMASSTPQTPGTAVLSTTPLSATPTSGTPMPAGSYVSSVSLSVENPTYSGTCPSTQKILATVMMNQAAKVTLELKVVMDTSGISLQMPEPYVKDCPAGKCEFGYGMRFSQSITGRLFVQITSPENVVSDPVELSIQCIQ